MAVTKNVLPSDGAVTPSHDRRAEVLILLVLSFANGLVALDRLAVNFLSPYIVADLGLSNSQLGLVASALSLAISVSGLILSAVADASGKRKRMLILALLVFSLLSAGSGLATGFATLAIARLLLGAGEGPVVPLAQAIMAEASDPRRRGLNMGAMQICGAFLIGAVLGPPLAVGVAERFGWQSAFFLTGVPGVVAVVLIAWVVPRDNSAARPRPDRPRRRQGQRQDIAVLLRTPNLLLSMAIAGLFTGWLMIQNIFMPLYLVRVDGFSTAQMSVVLSASGVGGVLGGVLIPALSDRLGRRPVLVATCFAGLAAPAAMLFIHGSVPLLAVAMGVSWLVMGCAPLVCAIVPGESVAPERITTAVALAMSAAEVVGGVLIPPIAGWIADRHGLESVFVMALGGALLCGILAMFLGETAPRVLARKGQRSALAQSTPS